MKRKRTAAPVAKDTLTTAIATPAKGAPSASDTLGSEDAPSAGSVPDATTPTTVSNRPTRGATKRRYTIADYPGFDDEDFEPDLADSSDDGEDENNALHSSKAWRKVSTSKKQNEPKPFPFLLLPAEIRNAIYAYALTTDNDIHIEAKTKASRRVATIQTPNDRNKRVSFSPALLATNRQVYQEAASVLYSQPLTFIDAYGLYSFLAQIGSARPLVDNITLESFIHSRSVHRHCNHSSFTMLIGCTNLKRVRLGRGVISWGRNTARMANHFYREAHYWLEVVGQQKGHKQAAVDLIEFTQGALENLIWVMDGRYFRVNPSEDLDGEKARQAEEKFRTRLMEML
ncbi:hypothetical protein H2201_003585 [Coniosporium apollinis]|uniref:2EXR domain-containing protein n=1 Tax=Coniosporium apollinis TaxID=61459 RepID=A0ABQ9P1Y1_9PEZI|nr:hypothetical protein H2201_003585 [Coniosporium apollinis]